ncbi:196_t:CDS:2, partial [Dentiscutata heterogama]
YPHGIYIPSNFTIPDGNAFKFMLYSGGHFWFKCNTASGNWDIDQSRNVFFNNKEDFYQYPHLTSAELDFRGISSIPNYDDSSMTVAVIGTAPSPNPRENHVKGGLPPPSKECGTKYPDGYIYSRTFTAPLLFYRAAEKEY